MKKFLAFFILFFVVLSAVQANDMRFIQVSDARFSKNDDDAPLASVINDINKQKNVEFVVFTGDNLCNPTIDNLDAFLNELKKLNSPFYIVLGEHDVNKHKNLSKVQYFKTINKKFRKYKQEQPNYVFEKNDLTFILLDGSKDVIPSTNGFYKADTLNWLDEQLSLHQNKKVIIFQHFPVIPPANKENYFTYKPENYLAIIQKHGNVKAVFTGHFGVNKEENAQGVLHVSTAGLPYYRIIDVLDYDTDFPTIWTTLKQIK